MDNQNLITIIKRSQKRDSKAFSLLVENFQSFAFSLAFKLICDEDEAKDIVQESFIKIWQNISKFDFKAKFTTWLYKIVYNQSLDKIKANKRRESVFTNTENISELSDRLFGNPEDDHINNDLANIIHNLAQDLTPKQHAVFVLRDLQGAEMDEISTITSLSKGAVKSNLYYARLNIREKLVKMETIKMTENEL